mgnify:CR=1 FL=1
MKKEITRQQIDTWNKMRESVKGTSKYFMFDVDHEYLNGKRWIALGWGGIKEKRIENLSDCFYLKQINGEAYVYFENCLGCKERWCLSDLAKAYFGVED